MAFPQVRHCVLCEEVRNELGNKISILGFFGILPDVQIGFPNGLGVIKVVFLLVCGAAAGGGQSSVSASIKNPDGSILVEARLLTTYFQTTR
jgi:hypothetical protein